MKTDIATIESLKPNELFVVKGSKLPALLVAIRKQYTKEVPDIKTEAGRKRIASLAHQVARTKTAIDGVGKEFVAAKKKALMDVDEKRRESRDYLDNLKAELRKPLDDYEEKEQKRIDKIKAKISHIEHLQYPTDPVTGALRTAEDLDVNRGELKLMTIGKAFQEFKEMAQATRLASIAALEEQWIPAAEKREADAKELEARRGEEAQASQEARDKVIADNAVEAAQSDQVAEQKATEERESDVKHRRKINNLAADALIGKGLSEADAKLVVKLIAKKMIPHIHINY